MSIDHKHLSADLAAHPRWTGPPLDLLDLAAVEAVVARLGLAVERDDAGAWCPVDGQFACTLRTPLSAVTVYGETPGHALAGAVGYLLDEQGRAEALRAKLDRLLALRVR